VVVVITVVSFWLFLTGVYISLYVLSYHFNLNSTFHIEGSVTVLCVICLCPSNSFESSNFPDTVQKPWLL
jgi:hypothetical protein